MVPALLMALMTAVFMCHSLIEVLAHQFHMEINFYLVLANLITVFYVIVPTLVAICVASTARDEVREPSSCFNGCTTVVVKLLLDHGKTANRTHKKSIFIVAQL